MFVARRAFSLFLLVTIAGFGALATGSVALAQTGESVWGTVPSPNRGTLNDTLYGLSSAAASDVWAVGDYNPGVPPTVTGRRTLAEHWNGQSWIIVPTPNATFSGVDASHLRGAHAVATNNVWAVGYGESFSTLESQTLIARWNGTRWTQVASPNPAGTTKPNQLYAIDGVAANDLWAVGAVGFPEGALTLHWDGASWQSVANSCAAPLQSVDAITSSNVWAVGNGASCHYDGTSWTTVPIALPNGLSVVLFGVSASSSADVWAVGEEIIPQGESYTLQSLVEHWNGSAWTVSTGVPGEFLNGVEAVAANDVDAVGGDGTYPVVAHWDGTSWTLVPSPRPGGGALQAVEAVSATNLWAVGSFFPPSPASGERTLIEQAPSTTQGTLVGSTNVSGATIAWFGPASGSVTTDLTGAYTAAGLLAGTYTVTATYQGCTPASAQVTIVAGITVTQNLHLGC
jgi:hypothetical protein